MDIRQLQDKLRDLSDRLPQDRGDRIKMIAVAIVLPVLVIWLAINVIPLLIPEPTAEELNTSGWVLVRDLNEKLNADDAFKDVGFTVESEDPLKFTVVGAVHHDRDLPKLESRLKELRPEGDYQMQVEVLQSSPQ